MPTNSSREAPAGRRTSPASRSRRKSPPTPDAIPTRDEHRWTFLTNHSHVLLVLASDPSLVLREVAHRVGITERAVQRIVADLEDEGFLERERVGRQNRYFVNVDRPLRHPLEAHHTIGELISLIGLK